jgi:flagellar biosynthesis/type III secretory pathway ATPase
VDAGLYASGSNPAVDKAIALHPRISAFLRQDREDRSTLSKTGELLAHLVEANA